VRKSSFKFLLSALPTMLGLELMTASAHAEPAVAVDEPAAVTTEPSAEEASSTDDVSNAAGTHVAFLSSDRPVKVYVAPADLPSRITRLGFTPINTTLAPGEYIVDIDGQDVARSTTRLHVGTAAQSVLIDPGSSNSSLAGTLMTCAGGVALFAGLVMAFGGTSESIEVGDSALELALLIGGGGVAITGLVITLNSTTSVESRPAESVHAPPSPGARAPSLVLSGTF
jgi:hypothetical protein